MRLSEQENFTPTPTQRAVLASPARFKILKCGRRWGKTAVMAYWQLRMAQRAPGRRHWYVAKSYRQAHEIAWGEYMKMLEPLGIRKFVERDLRIDTSDGSQFFLKGSDSISDSMRGGKLGSLSMDEAAFQRPGVYSTVLRPMLADYRAPAMISSSPKRGWFTQIFEYASKGHDKDHAAFHYTIYDNPYITREEIEQIKSTTPENVWKQEYLAEESEFAGTVYTEFNAKASIFDPRERFLEAKGWPCVLAVDWGLHDPTAAVWIHFSPDGAVVVMKEHVRNNWDVPRHAEVMERLSKGRTIAPNGRVLDRSAFRREGTSGASIAGLFQREGLFFQESDKDYNAGVDFMKRYMRGDGERPWFYVARDCQEIVKGLDEYEHNSHEPDALAAVRYGLVHGIKMGLSTRAPRYKSNPAAAMAERAAGRVPDMDRLPPIVNPDAGWDWDAGVPTA
jgi:hypothetical protein